MKGLRWVINWESVQSSGREKTTARISQMGVERNKEKKKKKKKKAKEGEMVGELWVSVCDLFLVVLYMK